MHEVGSSSQNGVKMVTRDGAIEILDGEHGCGLFEAIANSALALFVMAAAGRIFAANERFAKTAHDALIDADLIAGRDLTARVGWHQKMSWRKALWKATSSVRKITCGQMYRRAVSRSSLWR